VTPRRDGRFWEDQAGRYLQARGLRVLEARYRCRFGELDLICADRDSLVIVEVRARGRGSRLKSVETIDAAKRRKLVQAVRHLLMSRPRWSERPLRFDVVAIDDIDGANPRYQWIRNAFDAD
jgi:putative endonuclease